MSTNDDAYDAPAGPDWAGMVRVRCEELRETEEALIRVELGSCAAQLVSRHGLLRTAEDLERLAAVYRARAERDRAGEALMDEPMGYRVRSQSAWLMRRFVRVLSDDEAAELLFVLSTVIAERKGLKAAVAMFDSLSQKMIMAIPEEQPCRDPGGACFREDDDDV